MVVYSTKHLAVRRSTLIVYDLCRTEKTSISVAAQEMLILARLDLCCEAGDRTLRAMRNAASEENRRMHGMSDSGCDKSAGVGGCFIFYGHELKMHINMFRLDIVFACAARDDVAL